MAAAFADDALRLAVLLAEVVPLRVLGVDLRFLRGCGGGEEEVGDEVLVVEFGV